MKQFKNILLASVVSVGTFGFIGCKKSYLEKTPSDQESFENVFKTTQSSRVALNGLHRLMYESPDHNAFGQKSIDLMSDLMSDDMAISGFGAGWFAGAYNYNDAINGTGTAGYSWTYYFRIINNANLLIANIDDAEGPQEDKDDIKAQALFYRAFAYYNLSLYYQFSYKAVEARGGLSDSVNYPCVPVYLAPTQVGAARASVATVYTQIQSDLTEAIALLSFSGSGRTDKSQIDQSVVLGMKARVDLMMGNWSSAANFAKQARESYSVMTLQQCLEGLNDIKNSEWMWGSIINTEQTGIFASFLSHMDVDMNGYAALGMQKLVLNTVYNAMTATDVRKGWWYARTEVSGTVYKVFCQKKFRTKLKGNWAADQSYMRASEMLLIEAEGSVRSGSNTPAQDALFTLMSNRDPNYVRTTKTGQALLDDILMQRRIELWGEGFRYADMQRLGTGLVRQGTNHSRNFYGETGQINAEDPRFRFRIIQTELDANPLMIQNF